MKRLKKFEFSDKLSREYKDTPKQKFIYRVEETGELLEVHMAFGEMLERETKGGFLEIEKNFLARRCLDEELRRESIQARKRQKSQTRAKWPMVSVRAGVNPNQRQELIDFWKSKGVTGCTVLPNGDIRYESRTARKRDFEARQLFDRDGGYGDAMPKNL